jgi:UDP-N-acetylglucosamine transferase subunit ALG13
MIFVTVGNLDPFDRLVRSVDAWAGARSRGDEILMQIGSGRYRPQHCRCIEFLTPREFRSTFAEARFVVSHAGMGTIITALELAKPIVVMPKRAALGEQRNDHQLATVRRFRRSASIHVAESEIELPHVLDTLVDHLSAPATAGDNERWGPDPSLLAFVRDFIAASEDACDSADLAVRGALS